MATLIEKMRDNLEIHELKKAIEDGNINYIFFPDRIDLTRITNKDNKKDYIVKAIQRGYKITNGSPDYIKKNKRYLNIYIEKLRDKIENKNYSDLYDAPKEVIENLNTNRDYILKAIENGYDIFKDQKQHINDYIRANEKYIKYYIKITKNVETLNKTAVPEEMIKKISDENPNLMTQYIDYALKNNQDAWFVVKTDLKYIIYYISNVKEISSDFMYSMPEKKWEELEKTNPEIIDIAIKKCNDLNESKSDIIKSKHKQEYTNQILKNILDNKFDTLWNIDAEVLEVFSKNPDIVERIIDAGYFEFFYYTENNIENTKIYLEDMLNDDTEMLEYINEVTHNNFKNYGEFIYTNERLRSLLYEIKQQEAFMHMYDDISNEVFTVIDRFKELLKVTRISGMNLNYTGLLNIDDELIPKFKSKIYGELVLKEKNVFTLDIGTEKSVFEAIGIFGLFEEDKINANSRLNKLKEIINRLPNRINEYEYENICRNYGEKSELIEKAFSKVNGKKYFKKNNELPPTILEFYNEYFEEELSEKGYSFLKKLLPVGTIGSELNKYLKSGYEEQECTYYQLNNLTKEEMQELRNIIQNEDIEGALTKHSLHRIFSGFSQQYDKEFYEFFIKNIYLILSDEKNQRNVKQIQREFEKIKEETQTEQPTYAKVLEYINRVNYGDDIDIRFASELKKAGVSSSEAAKYYYDLHNEALKIDMTALPNYEKEYEEIIGNKKIKFRARRLEKKDPLLVLAGEKEYTNCCQTYNEAGEMCNRYSAQSKYSGVFVTEALLNGKWTMLTQSWDWVNNNVYCHDNIEGTATLKSHKEYEDIVLKMYEHHAKYVIKENEKDIQKYIEENEKISEDELKQLKNQIIKVVTVGITYNDISLARYADNKVKNPEKPIEYSGYRDSKEQLIISGEESNGRFETKPICIYKEKKIIKKCSIGNLSQQEQNRINNIMQENVSEIYKQAQIIFGDNWAIIYQENENGITIEAIKTIVNNNEELQQLKETIQKLNQIYPHVTVKKHESESQTLEKLIEDDEKTK